MVSLILTAESVFTDPILWFLLDNYCNILTGLLISTILLHHQQDQIIKSCFVADKPSTKSPELRSNSSKQFSKLPTIWLQFFFQPYPYLISNMISNYGHYVGSILLRCRCYHRIRYASCFLQREQEWAKRACRLRYRSSPVEERKKEGREGGKHLREQHSSKKGLAMPVGSV